MLWVITLILHISVLTASVDDKCNCTKTDKFNIILIKVKDAKDLKLNSEVNIFEATESDIENITRLDKDASENFLIYIENTNVKADSNGESNELYNSAEDFNHFNNVSESKSLNYDEVTPNTSLSNYVDRILDGTGNRRLNGDDNLVNSAKDTKNTLADLIKSKNEVQNNAKDVSIPVINLTVEETEILQSDDTKDISVVNEVEYFRNISDVEIEPEISPNISTSTADTAVINIQNKESMNIKEPHDKPINLNNEDFNYNRSDVFFNKTKVPEMIDRLNVTNNISEVAQNDFPYDTNTFQNANVVGMYNKPKSVMVKTQSEISDLQSVMTTVNPTISDISSIVNKGNLGLNITKNHESDVPNKSVISNTILVNPDIKTLRSKKHNDSIEKKNNERNIPYRDIVTDHLDSISDDENKPASIGIEKQNEKEDSDLSGFNDQNDIILDSIVNYLANQYRDFDELNINNTVDEMKHQPKRHEEKERENTNRIVDLSSNIPNKVLEQIDPISQMNVELIPKTVRAPNNSSKVNNKNSETGKHQERDNLNVIINVTARNETETHIYNTEHLKRYENNNTENKNILQTLKSYTDSEEKVQDNFDIVQNISKSFEKILKDIPEMKESGTTNTLYRTLYPTHINNNTIGNSVQNYSNVKIQKQVMTTNNILMSRNVNDKLLDLWDNENELKVQDIKALFTNTNAASKPTQDVPIDIDETNSITIKNTYLDKHEGTGTFTATLHKSVTSNLNKPLDLETIVKNETKFSERNVGLQSKLNTVKSNAVNPIYFTKVDVRVPIHSKIKKTLPSFIHNNYTFIKSEPFYLRKSINRNYLRHSYQPERTHPIPNAYITNNVIFNIMTPSHSLRVKPEEKIFRNIKRPSRTFDYDILSLILPQNILGDKYRNVNITNNPRLKYILVKK